MYTIVIVGLGTPLVVLIRTLPGILHRQLTSDFLFCFAKKTHSSVTQIISAVIIKLARIGSTVVLE